MSYREENEQVVLTMSREDYARLIFVFGLATAASVSERGLLSVPQVLELMNRLNQGNPNFTPYQVEAKERD